MVLRSLIMRHRHVVSTSCVCFKLEAGRFQVPLSLSTSSTKEKDHMEPHITEKSKLLSERTDYKRTNYGKFSLKFRGAQIWNKLPKDLKILKSHSLFKKATKVYVQNQRYF